MKKHRSRFHKPHASPRPTPAAPPASLYNGPLHRPLAAPPLDEEPCFQGQPPWLLDALRGPWKIPACNRTFALGPKSEMAQLWGDFLNANPASGPRLGQALMDAVLVANLMWGDPAQSLPLPLCDHIVGEYVRRFLWLPLPLSAMLQAHAAVDEPVRRLLTIHNQAALMHEPLPEMRALTIKGTLAQMRAARDLLPTRQLSKADPRKPDEDLYLLNLSPDIFTGKDLPALPLHH